VQFGEGKGLENHNDKRRMADCIVNGRKFRRPERLLSDRKGGGYARKLIGWGLRRLWDDPPHLISLISVTLKQMREFEKINIKNCGGKGRKGFTTELKQSCPFWRGFFRSGERIKDPRTNRGKK